jgi:SAM-dependent methyltransferase
VFSDADAAALYDVTDPWDPERYPADAFYTRLVMAAGSVLDVGCGTGSMLRHARDLGHAGRLAGIDPDPDMLARARRRTDVTWVLGTAAELAWDSEFDLATMTSHAFQCLIGDEEVRDSLVAVRTALVDGGRFAFETRNPALRAWEDWNPHNVTEVADAAGRTLRVWHRVEAVDGDVVTVAEITGDADGRPLREERARLRFLDVEPLTDHLARAGFAVEELHGDFHGAPFTPASREIVVVARRR